MIEDKLIRVIQIVELAEKRADETDIYMEKAAVKAAGFDLIKNYLLGTLEKGANE